MTLSLPLTTKRLFVYAFAIMKERMKLAAAIMVGLAVSVGAMCWWAFDEQVRGGCNEVARRAGLGTVFDDSADDYVCCGCTIDPEEHGVADTQVTESYSFSCTLRVMNQDLSPMMISAATKSLQVLIDALDFTLIDYTTGGGWPPGIVPDGMSPGADGFVYRAGFDAPAIWDWDVVGDNPQWIWVGSDTGWAGHVDISAVATHSYIDRARCVRVHRGSDAGPTHASEMELADQWVESIDKTLVCTLGTMTATVRDFTAISVPTPSTGILVGATMHKSIGEHDVTYGRFENIQVSNIPLQLDGLSKKADGAEYYLVGNGANIDLESRGFHVGDIGLGGAISPPFMLDLTQIALCDWGEMNHNSRYDNVLVWLHDGNAVCPCWQSATCTCPAPPGFWPRSLGAGINPLDCYCPFCGSQLRPHGMNRVSYIPAAWPDTSQTDWVSTGPFEECTACPLPIGELRRIFSPYVQRFAPYAGWRRTDGAKCEFWSGHIGLLLDRTSLRANNLPVSA